MCVVSTIVHWLQFAPPPTVLVSLCAALVCLPLCQQDFDLAPSPSLKSSTSLQATDRADPTGRSTSLTEVTKKDKSDLVRQTSPDDPGSKENSLEEERKKRAAMAAAAAER